LARKPRLFLDNVAQHIYLKGINQEDIFLDDEDYVYYKMLLSKNTKELHVKLHAFCLERDSIYFLATFDTQELAARFMQTLGLRYVSYFNKKYGRSGTLWEGRYKSSLVEDAWILSVMKYIDLHSNDLKKCTYTHNALGESIDFLYEHQMYKLLGASSLDRASIYKKLCQSFLKSEKNFIQEKLSKQLPTGEEEFYKHIELISGENLFSKKRGRPKKNKEKRKKMYSKLVVLDKKKHGSLKVSPLQDLNFAKDMNFIKIAANEAFAVGETFPVVFAADKDNFSLVALVSLGKGNLAINEEGKYITKYVPAFLRQYPFSFAKKSKDSQDRVVLIDEEASVVSKTKGKQLFTKKEEESEILKNAVTFLSNFDKDIQNTTSIVKMISESDILEEREISIGEGENKQVLIKGFKVINKDKLKNLDDKTLADWVRKGIISFIDVHIKSLEKIDLLFKLENNKIQQKNALNA
jgi:putative transposase